MMNFKKVLTCAALACSVSLASAPASAETLTFVSWMKDEAGYGDWWNEAIAEFEASHDGVNIEMTRVARDEYADTMFTMFAGGTPPDIVHLAAFEYQPFAHEGWLEPLDDRIADAGLNLEGWAGQSTCEWGGATTCLMLLYSGYIGAYNEKLLADAGVNALPTDWDSFLTAARAATRDTDGDGITDVFGAGVPSKGETSVMHGMLSFVLDAGGAWTVDGLPTFDSPETIEGLRRWKQLFDEKLTPPELDAGTLRQLLIEGRIAMTIDGPWMGNIIAKADDEIRPNLVLDKSPFKPNVGGTSNVIGMPSDLSDEKKDLVWDFIQLVASEKYQQRFATLGGSPAPRPGLDYTNEIESNPNFELFAEANATAADAGVDRLPKGLEIQFNEVLKIVFKESQKMLVQDLDPAQAAQNIQEAVVKIRW